MATSYPAVEEFNRRYNNLLRLTNDQTYNMFMEQTVATLIRLKEGDHNGHAGNVVVREKLP